MTEYSLLKSAREVMCVFLKCYLIFFFFFFFKRITLQPCVCRRADRKTLMKINVSEIWNAHLALHYIRSGAIVLYVALLITRWFRREKKKTRGEDTEGGKKKEEMTPNKQKRERWEKKDQTKQSCLSCVPSLRAGREKRKSVL